jgi:hypothetical protein
MTTFEQQYPNIDRWVNEHQGWLEIGYDLDSPLNSFIRVLDCGGMPWQGKNSYDSLDEALQDANQALAEVLKDIYGK